MRLVYNEGSSQSGNRSFHLFANRAAVGRQATGSCLAVLPRSSTESGSAIVAATFCVRMT